LDSEEEAHHFFEKSGSEDDDKVTNIGYGNDMQSLQNMNFG
jgi:hypothetical protein